MKFNLFMVIVHILFYQTSEVNGTCFTCPPTTAWAECQDFYLTNGRENDICARTDRALCQKYDGGYAMYCDTGGNPLKCRKVADPCPDAAANYVSMNTTVILFSVLFAITIRVRFE